jgi:propionate catabolism operon transcriptional regulator
VLPAVRCGSVLTRGWPDLDSVEQLGHRTVVVNRVPVFEQGVQTGAVLTVVDSGEVERVTTRLRLHHQVKARHARYHLDQVIAVSTRMKQLLTLCETYAKRSDTTVLISGESGTGKELIAQGIHNASRRATGPFLAINCGAFTESLLESELFGYEEGSFTGARRGGKAGLFEAAHQGTLFLDEIGEMPLVLQVRLLRVLQEKEVMRVGGRESIPVDVRVISATHRDLLAMVGQQQFRQDLFYRLNILQAVIPPLRERPEDMSLLAATLVNGALKRAGLQDQARDIVKAVMPLFLSHTWPGNVRELENAAERLAIGCIAIGAIPAADDLQRLLPELHALRLAGSGPRPSAAAAFTPALKAVTRQTEKVHLQTVLSDCAGNQTEAARRLGISRATLWRKLRP